MVEVCVCHDADIDIAARTLYGLCRGEPLDGQQAVAWVIRTRAFSGGIFGRSVKEVCLRHDDHFPCWERNGPERAALLALRDDAPDLPELRDIVRAVFEGDVPDPACDAKGRHPTHFERIGAGSAWAKGKPIAKVIGCHAFYVIA
jgi:spore germination cell wall hydrolase CwlJ-like protein